MQARHEAIGDVRGMGLFLGVEMVLDRAKKTPAPQLARYVKDRLREQRILIGTDGPFDNVLKIRPPMTFDDEAVDVLLTTMDQVLTEDGARFDRGSTGQGDGQVRPPQPH
ncbi:MAG: aminotransferase class III-fold pyridoxal phosphate-dependent enzyme, partial [Planctomycetota bacterium]